MLSDMPAVTGGPAEAIAPVVASTENAEIVLSVESARYANSPQKTATSVTLAAAMVNGVFLTTHGCLGDVGSESTLTP
jgi:hypothetical protein